MNLSSFIKRLKPTGSGNMLSNLEHRIVGAVADTFFPPAGPIPLSGREAGIVRYFDGYIGRSRPLTRNLMRLLLAFTEMSPLVFGPRRTRFTSLTHRERVQLFAEGSVSPIYFRRIVFISLRAISTFAYFANPDVAAHIGVKSDVDPFGLGEEGALAAEVPSISGVRLKTHPETSAPTDSVTNDDNDPLAAVARGEKAS